MESVYLWLLDSDHQSFEVVCSLCDVSQIFFFQTLRKFEQIFEQTKWKETIETSREATYFENKRKNLRYKISARKKNGKKCGNLSVKKVAHVSIVKSKRFADEKKKFIQYVFSMILKGTNLREAREKKKIEWKIEIVVDSQYFFLHSLDYVKDSINMKINAILS